MKNRIKTYTLLLIISLIVMSCGNKEKEIKSELEDSKEIINDTVTTNYSDKLEGEDGIVRWVRGHSGNLMMTMARENGYLEEYGLKVEEIPMQTVNESFSAVSGDQVDIVSNAGTNFPLQRIAAGDDIVIFGGHMVEGSVTLVAPSGTVWNGYEDLIGKRVAGDASSYVLTGPLLEMGYNPHEDIEWVKLSGEMDSLSAIKTGQVDYASAGTSLTYQAKNDPEIEFLMRYGDLMPDYSCCRMETASRFVDKKPNTTKALLKALLRGLKDYHNNPKLASEILAKELDVPLEFVEAYTMDKDGYKIHPDPLYNSCVRAWAYIGELGLLDEEAKSKNLRDNINVDLYKEALDEVIAEVGTEDPEWWDEQLKYFEENNSMYYDEELENQYYENFQKTIAENRDKNAK